MQAGTKPMPTELEIYTILGSSATLALPNTQADCFLLQHY